MHNQQRLSKVFGTVGQLAWYTIVILVKSGTACQRNVLNGTIARNVSRVKEMRSYGARSAGSTSVEVKPLSNYIKPAARQLCSPDPVVFDNSWCNESSHCWLKGYEANETHIITLITGYHLKLRRQVLGAQCLLVTRKHFVA